MGNANASANVSITKMKLSARWYVNGVEADIVNDVPQITVEANGTRYQPTVVFFDENGDEVSVNYGFAETSNIYNPGEYIRTVVIRDNNYEIDQSTAQAKIIVTE